jgi:hypothetical protein
MAARRTVTPELMYEVLKSIQAQVALIREDVDSIKLRLTSIARALVLFIPTWRTSPNGWIGLKAAWAALKTASALPTLNNPPAAFAARVFLVATTGY